MVCPLDKSTTSFGTMLDENDGAHRALIFASTWDVIIRISALLSSGDTATIVGINQLRVSKRKYIFKCAMQNVLEYNSDHSNKRPSVVGENGLKSTSLTVRRFCSIYTSKTSNARWVSMPSHIFENLSIKNRISYNYRL
jgi:hypothetical protein